MTHDDIIRMAHEADCLDDQHYGTIWTNRLEHFAALVAAAEREACAQVCDKRAADYRMGFEEKYEAQACAYDIRARGGA